MTTHNSKHSLAARPRSGLLGVACMLAVVFLTAPLTAEPEKTPPPVRVISPNGNKLSGKTISYEKGHLILDSDLLKSPAKLKLDQLISVQLDHPPLPLAKHPESLFHFRSAFRMKQADYLAGELISVSKESIVLKTKDNGTKTIKRAFIRSIDALQSGKNYYRGPNSAKEWGIDPKKNAWKYTRNSLSSQGNGGAGRDVKLSDISHISFSAKWETSMRFRIHLYSSDATDDSPDAYYDLNFNRSYVYLRTRGKVDNTVNHARGGRWKQLNIPRELTQAKFDIFTNRKTGVIIIYINNLKAATLESQNPRISNLGTGMSFIAEERYPITISNITIRPWDGLSELDSPIVAAASKNPHPFLSSTNGKTHAFTSLKKENNHYILTLLDEATTIRIPITNVLSITMPPEGQQPRKYNNDVRVLFQPYGQLTFQLKSIKNGQLHGHSKLLGDITYDLRNFTQIEFNIYDHKYEKLRDPAP